jgi:hypothetical protein
MGLSLAGRLHPARMSLLQTADGEAEVTAFERYAAMTERLKSLWATGKGESPEADALRDEMTPVWWQLTAAEQDQFCLPNPEDESA